MLVGVGRGMAEEDLDELAALADSAGAEPVARIVQSRAGPDPATYVGKGKLGELHDVIHANRADAVILDQELSPGQLRSLEERLGVKVIDRTALILDIFALHARSREGKVQVELAQLNYLLPRLRGWGEAMSRLGGGIGTRGPGETKMEVDRQHIRRRITKLPMGWAAALAQVAEPADLWHGMWAASLPALDRLRREHAGRTVYDSRDIYVHARGVETVGRGWKWLLGRLERRWARRADAILTVNDAYARILAGQFRVAVPPVVRNTPRRYDRPTPPPDRIRQRLGLPSSTAVVLYQGGLMSDRGIEQSMEAILAVPEAVLVLMGFGSHEDAIRRLAASARYADRVRVIGPADPVDAPRLDRVGRRHGDGHPADLAEPPVHHAEQALGGDRRRRARRGLGPAGDVPGGPRDRLR